MDELQSLTTAMDDVVGAHYPVQLHALRKALYQSQPSTIFLWTHLRPCQIEPLIRNLSHRRNHDQECALDSLMLVLRCKPMVKAISAGDGHFWNDLCQHAAGKLTGMADHGEKREEWVQTLLPLLDSGLSMLSDEVLLGLMSQWKALLRSNNHQDAVAAVQVAHRLSDQMTDSFASTMALTSTSANAMTAWRTKASAMFQGSKAISVIDTLMLVALKACSTDGAESVQDGTYETIEKCMEVICGMRRQALEEWAKNNGAVLMKLNEKCMSCSEPRTQLAVFCILYTFSDDGSADHSLHLVNKVLDNTLEDSSILLRVGSGGTRDMEATRTLVISALRHGQCLHRLLSWVLESCRPKSPDIEVHQILVLASRLIATLAEDVVHKPQYNVAVFETLERLGIPPDWWSLDLSTPASPKSCLQYSTCIHKFEQRRQQLCTEISWLFLQTASGSNKALSQETSRVLRSSLTALTSRSDSVAQCEYDTPFGLRLMGTMRPAGSNSSKSWRERLHQSMTESGLRAHEEVEYLISEICKDLQDRCDHVEMPLRAAQEHAELLKQELSEKNTYIEQLKADEAQRGASLEHEIKQRAGLELQKCELSGKLDRLQDAFNACQERLTELEAESERDKHFHQLKMQESKEDAEMRLIRVRQAFSEQFSGLEDKMRTKVMANEGLRGEYEWLKEEAALLRQELASAHDKASALEEQHQTEMEQLRERTSSLEDQLNSGKQQLEQVSEAARKSESDGQRLLAELQEAKELAEGQELHVEEMIGTVDDLRAALDQARREIADLHNQQQVSEEDNSKLKVRIGEMKVVEVDLRKECREQSKALHQAKKAEQSIMAIFRGQEPSVTSSVGTTATMTPSQSHQTSIRHLPEFSFVSEDDEDYSEVLKAT